MMNYTVHGIILLSITMSLLVLPGAHATSPYSQFQSGISLEDIQCTNEKTLLESPRGTPACVKESSVERLVQRGFVLIPQMVDKIKDTADELPPKPVSDKSDDPATSEPVILDVASGNNKFAVDFYKQVSDNDDNIFFSPTSMYMAFSALNEGARGNTADQIRQVFKLEPDSRTRHSSIEQFTSHINQDDQYATLTMANALWIEDEFPVHDAYVDSVRKFYKADVEILDLLNTGEMKIDKWAANNTDGIIDDIIAPSDLTNNTVMVITNAIYFAGEWERHFLIDSTYSGSFWKNSTESVDVDLMYNKAHFHYAALEDVQVLEVPYKGNRLSMLVILPNDIDGIGPLEESITAEMIETWKMNLGFKKTEVTMPKFKISTDYDLYPSLKAMGITDVFNPRAADLTGISDIELYLGKAKQKTFVEIDEVGTKAAAVTMLATDSTSGPESFKATHPFIFLIQDDKTGAILFMGRISDPTIN